MQLTVNARLHRVAAPQGTLLDLLRDDLALTGTKLVCDRGECGACTVLLDGRTAYACLTLAAACDGATITTVEAASLSGFTYPELLDVFPGQPTLERTSMNSWDDQKVRDALAKNNRKKVVVAGLWTEVCNCTFALSAMHDADYEIYMVADASGGTSKEAHDYAMQRMVQAGVVPVTWQQVLLEWQRDWAHRDTYDAVMKLVKEHSGAYGMGVDYAYTMVHKAPQRTATPHEALAAVPAR